MTMTELKTLPDVRGWLLVSPSERRAALSPREQQILELVTAGRSQKEVAFDLGLSDATVRVLYSRAMKKLGRRRGRRPAESRR
jgi:DNA-binding NarL/FixJ family response regulator